MRARAQSRLDQGQSLSEIAAELGLNYDVLRKAVADGRLKKSLKKDDGPAPEGNPELSRSEESAEPTSKSQRSAQDAAAPMGVATTNVLDRVMASEGLLPGGVAVPAPANWRCPGDSPVPKTCLVLPDGFGQSVPRMHKGSDLKPAGSGTAEGASGGEAHASLPALTGEERGQLLALARRAIAASLSGLGEPEIDVSLLPPAAALPHGCFVTLTIDGELRGCIGNTVARLPLHRAIVQHAIQAAREDRRFESITSPELDRIEIELSILSAVRPLRAANPEEVLRLLRPHQDGVLLRVGPLGATYLPQVWEKIPDSGAFMASLSRKAGLGEAGWRDRQAQISIYEVLAFSEKETMKPDR